MAKTSPFDHDTLNALSLFLQLQADEDIYLDDGFAEGAVEPAYGEMKVREAWEYQLKGQAFEFIHECGKAAGDLYKLVAYRFILHSLDPLKYWNEFNGLLFVDETKTKWIMIDYHESDKQMRALTIAARNERTRLRAEKLFGMLKFVGGIDPKFLLATWIGPGSPLSSYIISPLQNVSLAMTPAQLTRKPPSVHFITEESYLPSLTSDDCANITLALVMQLGPIPSDSFGGEERQEMVMKKGCEGCGKMDGIEMKKCGACKGPLYCSKTCQTSLWKGHKTTCKREVSLAEFNDQEEAKEAKEALEAKSSKGHVHDAGCSHGSKQSKRSAGGEE